MNSICRDIFRAIHEGKWLSIEYRNKEEKITKYWIGIRGLNPIRRSLSVDGLHLGKYTTDVYECIYIDAIISSQIIEGSYCPVNKTLVQDIALNPHRYQMIFDHPANLKILNYLEMCNRMDNIPYYTDYELIRHLDRESFRGDTYELNKEQFEMIVKNFQYKTKEQQSLDGRLHLQQLAMNVLSIHTPRGLYVFAYRKMRLDVKKRTLRPDEEITVCTEYTLNGTEERIRRYLDAEEYELLKDFEKNQEQIKDCLSRHGRHILHVDDMPYLIGLGMDVLLDLHKEYEAIMKMYQKDKVTVPIKAFFGDLLRRPISRTTYPITLVDKNVNLDQLLAIHNAMKYPVAYIQGPPGTGKTSTIINTMMTAFFNEKTVLFASHNNHPINGVVEKLSNMQYHGKRILFPVLRLGNSEKVREALITMRKDYETAKTITVYESTLERKKGNRKERAKALSNLLRRYEELLDLKERQETLNRLLDYEKGRTASMQMLPFESDLSGRQMKQIKREMDKTGEITEEQAFSLLDDDMEELKKYLYYTSAGYLQKIDLPQNRELKEILLFEEGETQINSFKKYLSKKANIRKLQKIYPIIATTCISAHRLGEPEPMFDMVIMDEASQCNTAISLVPIIRGESLMLVGDPQQLNPVIQLDELTNQKLRKKYSVSDEYDYRKNSIYKTYLSCDAVSDEILLHYHYRCHEKIIEFNNKKYYNSKLCVKAKSEEENPLVYIDVEDSKGRERNTAPAEVEEIIKYASQHKDKSIGIITPFVNQKNLIEQEKEREGLTNISCGTVHAFQGDEKDVILFSTVITDQTGNGTYEWLKNNKELINVATSRAKDKLVILSNQKNLERLHKKDNEDDLYELIQYVRKNGDSIVTGKAVNSRALGVKPFSTATEEAFLKNLSHALENIWLSEGRFQVHKEVAISQVFQNNVNYSDLFYTGRFDFVVYEQTGGEEMPVLAIELDGKEHFEDEVVKERDRKKNEICNAQGLQIIRVENSYARRYNHIKEILENYFNSVR